MTAIWKRIPGKGPKGGEMGWSTRDGDSDPKHDQTVYEKTGFNRVEKRDVHYDPTERKYKK